MAGEVIALYKARELGRKLNYKDSAARRSIRRRQRAAVFGNDAMGQRQADTMAL